MILGKFLARHVRLGLLTVIDAKGQRTELGQIDADTPANEPHVVLRTASEWTELGIALNPGLNAGEAIMDGTLAVERGSIYDFLSLILRNTGLAPPGGAAWYIERALIGLLRRLHQYNPISRSQSNVAHHYDLSKRLYEMFLDTDMQYSCAYFERPDATLEEAQAAKKRHIATKLCLQPGQRVLDIGCGWGGLALAIARSADVEVLGITLSKEQLEVARARAAAAGLADRVRFELVDYRALDARFDRIVSVGMLEHVGLPHYGAFFSTLRDRLNDGGIALLHAIGRSDGPGITNAWIRKYIFPGGYAPSLSQVLPHIERSELFVTDIEILRLHYAETLRHWRLRSLANRAEIARLYDERFCRMWEFYLAASECAFRFQGQMVFQNSAGQKSVTVPATRDWMYAKPQ